ncbi:MAG TPA: penicillin-binding protein, partial [Mucilaginibacter sp.]
MRRPDPKYIRLAVIIAACLFVLVLIAGFIIYNKREAILQHELSKATIRAKKQYNLDLKIASAHFKGISTIDFQQISIVPEGKDSLLSIHHFDVSVKLWPLLFGKIKLAGVILQNGHLNLTNI